MESRRRRAYLIWSRALFAGLNWTLRVEIGDVGGYFVNGGDGELVMMDDELEDVGNEQVVGDVDKNGKGERASVATGKGEKTTRRGKEARTSEPVPIRLIPENSVRRRRSPGIRRSFQTPPIPRHCHILSPPARLFQLGSPPSRALAACTGFSRLFGESTGFIGVPLGSMHVPKWL